MLLQEFEASFLLCVLLCFLSSIQALELVSIKLSPQTCRGGSDPMNVEKNRYQDRLPCKSFNYKNVFHDLIKHKVWCQTY